MKRLLIAAILCTGAAYAEDSKEPLVQELGAKHCSYHAKQKSEKKKAHKAKKKEDKAKKKAFKKAKKDKKKAHKASMRQMKKQRKADKKKKTLALNFSSPMWDMPLAPNPRAPRGSIA